MFIHCNFFSIYLLYYLRKFPGQRVFKMRISFQSVALGIVHNAFMLSEELIIPKHINKHGQITFDYMIPNWLNMLPGDI